MLYLLARGVEENELYYFELDENGIAYRQVTVTDGRSLVSAAPDFMLSEKVVERYEGDEDISREAFQAIWQKATAPRKAAFEQAKQRFLPGDPVTGTIAMFYPQGVIIKLSDEVYAVADDAPLRAKSKREEMSPGYIVQGTIQGYEEDNFWLVLADCTIIGKKPGA
ncbi:hypothetical protein [Brevibacillus parabrevis]|uniref:hypothetical protein n=1 Tax=Brevibacillus parabrevis TaxID=54914 RepID=UPI0028D740AD|nr:hypothetical protein [Brevibacillus parabrevis]